MPHPFPGRSAGPAPAAALAAPAPAPLPFADVKAGEWYEDAVRYVYEKGIMSGTDETAFTPDGKATRGMVVTILHRLAGKPASKPASFLDVPAWQYYTDAVGWAAAAGVVSGYSDEAFGPNDPVTREQLTAILFRYARSRDLVKKDADPDESALDAFRDRDRISGYARPAMAWAVSVGLLNGTGDGKEISPDGQATRAQLAALLARFGRWIDPERKQVYTVTFDYNYEDQGTYQVMMVRDGEPFALPADPVREGYVFQGWYTAPTGGGQFTKDTPVARSVIVYARWTPSGV